MAHKSHGVYRTPRYASGFQENFPERALFRRLLALLALLHTLVLRLHHLVEFLFLVVAGQGTADLGDGALAQRVNFLDLVFTLQRGIIDDRHRLAVLVLEHGLDFGLLVGREVQLLGEDLHLVVDGRRLSWLRWLLLITGLRLLAGRLARRLIVLALLRRSLARLAWLRAALRHLLR